MNPHAHRPGSTARAVRAVAGVLLLVACLFAILQARPARAEPPTGPTASTVTLVGEQGEDVTQGGAYLWRSGPDTIKVTKHTYDAGLTVDVSTPGSPANTFQLRLSPATGQTLTSGVTYTMSTAGGVQPSLYVGGNGTSCFGGPGRFTVLDITPDLSRLWVVYQQACRYSPEQQFGEIRINEPVGPGTFLAPSQISWPTQYMGAAIRSVPVTIINLGDTAVVVSGARVEGPAASDYAVDSASSCTAIAPGGACTFDVGFTPQEFGDRTATLTVDDSTGTHTANLQAPVGPTSTVSMFWETAAPTSGTLWRTGPDRIDVGGSPSGRVAVTLTRGGSNNQTYLAFNPPTGQVLTAGVTYRSLHHTQTDADHAGMAIGSCNSEYGEFKVLDIAQDLSRLWVVWVDRCDRPDGPATFGEIRYGEPNDPDVLIAPTRIRWPDQTVGSPARRVPVTVVNTDQAPLALFGVTTEGPAAAEVNASPVGSCSTIAPGATCALDVGFTPAEPGERDATFAIADSTPQGRHTFGVVSRAVSPSSVTVNGSASGTWRTGRDRVTLLGSPSGVTIKAGREANSADGPVLTLLPPEGGRLTSGVTYRGATGSGTSANVGHVAGTPTIKMTLGSQACTHYTGQFTVIDISQDLQRLWAVYEVTCGNNGMWFGEVRYGEPLDPAVLVTPGQIASPSTGSSNVPVSVVNTGRSPVKVLGIAVDGPLAARFNAQPGDCVGTTLAVGAACQAWVSYSSGGSPGRNVARLTITDTSPAGAHHVGLGGFSNTPSTATVVGGAGEPITAGNSQFFRSGVDRIDRSSTPDGAVEFALAHGSDAPITVRFNPAQGNSLVTGTTYEDARREGGRPVAGHPGVAVIGNGVTCESAGRFQVITLAANFSHVWIVYEARCATGTVFGEIRYLAPADDDITIAPRRVDWPQSATTTHVPVHIVNTGTGPLTISDVTIAGPSAAEFSTNGVGSCSTIPAGATCDLEVAFAPTAGFGLRQATLQISDSSAARAHSVSLVGDLSAPVAPPQQVQPQPIQKTSVSVTGPTKVVPAGKQVKITAKVQPVQSGRAVRLQKYVKGKWKTVATARSNATGRAVFSVKAAKGSTKYRATAAADARHQAGTSKQITVRAK